MSKSSRANTDPENLADLAEAIMRVARQLHVLTAHSPDVIELTQLEAMILRHVDAHPGIAPSTISHDLRVLPSNTSAALRHLRQHGLIDSTADPADRRRQQLHPTHLVRSNLAAARRGWSTELDRAALTDAEVRDLMTTLLGIENTLNGVDAAETEE